MGAIAPDVSLYVMVAVSIWVMDIPARRVFGELYYSDAWQAVFAVDNSFILWGLGLGIALWRRASVFVAFCAAGLLHLAFDFPLHTHDARQHFWPVTDWVFESPVSYWDNAAHAGIVSPVALFLSAGALGVIWVKSQKLWLRLLACALFLMELLSSGIWRFIF